MKLIIKSLFIFVVCLIAAALFGCSSTTANNQAKEVNYFCQTEGALVSCELYGEGVRELSENEYKLALEKATNEYIQQQLN